MSDELEVLKIVCRRLGDAGVPYMLSGSMALNLYAQPRMTRDIDIVVHLDSGDAGGFAQLFGADFYCDAEAVREAIERKGMFNIIHNERIVKVDFVIRKGTLYRAAEFARRRCVQVDDQSIWVVAPEDLLLSKLEWARDGGSEVQLSDARNLAESAAEMDWNYVEQWATTLGLSEMLARVRA
jgi:hypothetical protein